MARATSSVSDLIHPLNKELIHAAIQIMREKAAKIFITVSSALEQDVLLRQYHVA
jgi:hypothetical protein